jgi:hypothetical protein
MQCIVNQLNTIFGNGNGILLILIKKYLKIKNFESYKVLS